MTIKQPKRLLRRSEKGQSLAEFVLVLPIFLILVFAIIDFGLGFHAWLTVTNSPREGARLGAVRAPASGACDMDPSTKATNSICRDKGTASSLDRAKLAVTVTGAQGTPGHS